MKSNRQIPLLLHVFVALILGCGSGDAPSHESFATVRDSLEASAPACAAPRTSSYAGNRLQPIAVAASNSYPGFPPCNAIDGDSSTAWNSGGFPTQWIELDLGKPLPVRRLRLQLAQNPAGNIAVSVAVGADRGSMRNVYARTTYGTDAEWLELTGDGDDGDHLGNARYVRITTNSGPSWVAWKEIEVYGGVEAFGFYSGDGFWVTTPQNLVMSYTFTDVPDAAANVQSLRSVLQQVKASGARAFIWPDLWSNNSSTKPYDDWMDRWSQVIVPAVQGYEDVVAAFYLYDEPYGHGVARADLSAVADQMRCDFPSIPVASILSSGELWRVVTDASYVSMFDWVGFDCYADWYGCGNDGAIAKLRRLLTDQQRMIAVPWVQAPWSTAAQYFGPNGAVTAIGQEWLIDDDTKHWQRQVVSDAKYAMVLPFIWENPGYNWNGSPVHGAVDMPWMREAAYQLGASVLPMAGSRVFPRSIEASSDSAAPRFGAFDEDETTIWNSGGFPNPDQWIEADFAGSTHLTRIQLDVAQQPNGPTVHTLQGLLQDGTWFTLGTFSGWTTDGQQLTWTGSADVIAVAVTTTTSPSWVAWKEIAFYDEATVSCSQPTSYPLSITVDNGGCGSIPLQLNGTYVSSVDAGGATGWGTATFPAAPTLPAGATAEVTYAPTQPSTCNCSTHPNNFPYHGGPFTIIPPTSVMGPLTSTIYCGPIIQ
jgi:hypothetical protein